MGMCNLSGPGADLMLARLAARHSVPLGVSTVASTPMEKLIEVAEGHAWFQLYFSGDGTGTFKLVERAKAAGYETLVLTVDVPEVGRRPRELAPRLQDAVPDRPATVHRFCPAPALVVSTCSAGKPQMANFEMDGYDV